MRAFTFAYTVNAPSAANYLAGYPAPLAESVHQAIAGGHFAHVMRARYPAGHTIRSDSALYSYVEALRARHLRNSGKLARVSYDNTIRTLHNALGTHARIVRSHGGKLATRREIRIAGLFRELADDFLHMIVVHELAHLREAEHNKAFYQLCQHMAPDYFQLEFDLRSYLTYRDAGGAPLWTIQVESALPTVNGKNS